MKKIPVFVLSLACVLLLLCACSSGGEQPTATPSPTPVETVSPEPTVTPDPVVTETPEPEPSPDPAVTGSPAPTEPPGPEPVDYVAELPLDTRAQRLTKPKFLSNEQKKLYQKANTLYRALFGGDTWSIDYFDAPEDYVFDNETVELDGVTYRIAKGRYADWEVFDAVIHGLFTDEFWRSRNRTAEGYELFREYEGKLVFAEASRDSGLYYRDDRGDEFELVSQTEDEIVFTLTGHYRIPLERENDNPYDDDGVYYEDEFTVRMVRTEDGWRFDEFHDAMTDERSLNGSRETPEEAEDPVEENFLLPVSSHTMAGGFEDLYAVTEDGTLLMWGVPEFTEGLYGGELGGEPVVLMEHVAGIYCGNRGNVVAVDEQGTLWALDGVSRYSRLNPDAADRTSFYEPVWVMDDVAKVSVDFFGTLILQRDGTLWLVDLGGEVGKIMEQVTDAWQNGYGGYARTTDGTLWHWGTGPEAFDPVVMEEVPGWLDPAGSLNEDGSLTVRGVTIPQVVQVSAYWALQEDGSLWNWGDEEGDDVDSPPTVVLTDVKQFTVSEQGVLALKQDGTYWYSRTSSFGGYHPYDRPLEFSCVYEGFLLPVYPHTMDAGEADYYAVLDDGRLVVLGESYYFENPSEDGAAVLMENAAAVYEYHSSMSGTAAAIDRDGTLWGLYGSICRMNPDYNRETSEGPVWLMDDVAMVSITRAYTYILKRDGTLWHWGALEGFPGFHDYQWADPENPGKPADGKNTLTKIMDHVVLMGANNSGSGGGWAVTADGALWEWYTSHEIRKVSDQVTREELKQMQYLGNVGAGEMPGVAELFSTAFTPVSQIGGNYGLQENGTLWYYHDAQHMLLKYLEDVEQIAVSDSGGILLRRTDGSYWLWEKYDENGSERSPYKFDPVKVLDPVQ